MEISFIQSLEISSGNLLIFVERPISLGLLLSSIIILMISILFTKRTKRRMIQETGESQDMS